jgi:hypothetical protein
VPSEVVSVSSFPLEFDLTAVPSAADERSDVRSEARTTGPRTGAPLPATDGQLALQLPSELPHLSIAPEWKDQQRLWGHSFHPMCSYLASFPAGLVHAFIARYTRPGDVVLDPFSGRGTTPLQACAEGRIGAADKGRRQDPHSRASPGLGRHCRRVERNRRSHRG